MKLEKYLYDKVKEDARYISEIAKELSTVKMIEDDGLLSSIIDSYYESKKLREIKNALSNIYLILELHEVKGDCDQIYNAEFKPLD